MIKNSYSGLAQIALMLAMLPICGCTSAVGPTIALSPPNDTPRLLIVSGLDQHTLDSFPNLEPSQHQQLLQVWVAQAPTGSPPLLGEVARRGHDLIFTPRYPFQPGLKYRASFDPAALGSSASPLATEFTIPAPQRDPVVGVAAIYPSADELPENLLKFYIQFSAPMSRGDAYQHIHLLDDRGQPIAAPFLELGEELWDPQMTRFTLFFDPGRVKQGLTPRLELGPPLVNGKTYTLVVDAAWPDSENRPLVQSFKKTFRTTATDTRQPDPSRWRITAPLAGSTGKLIVLFDKPLDRAMLQHVLSVVDGEGQPLAGKVSIAEHERQWSFTPEAPWHEGRYLLVAETILEDTAGNSIGRPFEVDLKQGPSLAERDAVKIPVDVQQRK